MIKLASYTYTRVIPVLIWQRWYVFMTYLSGWEHISREYIIITVLHLLWIVCKMFKFLSLLSSPLCVTQDEPRLRSYHRCSDKRKRLHPGPEQLRVPQHPRGGAPLLHSASAFQWCRTHDSAAPSASRPLTPPCPDLGIQNKRTPGPAWTKCFQKSIETSPLWSMCTSTALSRCVTWLCDPALCFIFIWRSENTCSSLCVSLDAVLILLWCAADAKHLSCCFACEWGGSTDD